MHFTCCMFPSTGLLQCLYAMMSSIPRPNEAPLYRSPFYQFHSFSSFLWKFIFFIFLYIETYYYIVFRSIIRRRLIIRLKPRMFTDHSLWSYLVLQTEWVNLTSLLDLKGLNHHDVAQTTSSLPDRQLAVDSHCRIVWNWQTCLFIAYVDIYLNMVVPPTVPTVYFMFYLINLIDICLLWIWHQQVGTGATKGVAY